MALDREATVFVNTDVPLRLAPSLPDEAVKLAVEVVGSRDEREVGERLREVAQGVAAEGLPVPSAEVLESAIYSAQARLRPALEKLTAS